MANGDKEQASVAGETVKGAAKGVGAVALGAVALVAGAAALVAAAVVFPVGAIAVAGGGLLAGAAAYAGSNLLAAGAAVGGGYGLYKSISKNKELAQEKELNEEKRNQAIANTITATAQQAYMAGARDVQAHIVNELHKAQEAQAAMAQETQTNFAARVAQTRNSIAPEAMTKNSITPEAIIKQREAAAAASNQVN